MFVLDARDGHVRFALWVLLGLAFAPRDAGDQDPFPEGPWVLDPPRVQDPRTVARTFEDGVTILRTARNRIAIPASGPRGRIASNPSEQHSAANRRPPPRPKPKSDRKSGSSRYGSGAASGASIAGAGLSSARISARNPRAHEEDRKRHEEPCEPEQMLPGNEAQNDDEAGQVYVPRRQ